MNGDWELRNVTSDIEEKEIEMTVMDVKKRKKRK
jgi:hypothetical protein